MDYRYETKDESRCFHIKRKAFIIYNGNLEFLPRGSNMSHYEYCKNKGITKEEFNEIIRGYFLDGNLVIYRDNFIYDNELILESLKYIDRISKEINESEFDIYFGQLPKKDFKLDYHYGKYIDGNINKE